MHNASPMITCACLTVLPTMSVIYRAS